MDKTFTLDLGRMQQFRADNQRARDALRVLGDQLIQLAEHLDAAGPPWWYRSLRTHVDLLGSLKQVALDSVSAMRQVDPDDLPF